MKLTLIRHSKTSVEPDVPILLWHLSKEGAKLARRLAKRQVIRDLDVIYSSLQTKALETARLLVQPNSLQVKTNKDLTEISSFTQGFIGQVGDGKFQQFVNDFYQGKIKRHAGGESYDEALERFMKAIKGIIKEGKTKGMENIGIVSHGNILSFFSGQYCKYSPLQLHNMMRMPDVAVLDWDEGKFISFFGQDF
jgi:broad specificity phosphatase PhoE